jgi:hypothetical protein
LDEVLAVATSRRALPWVAAAADAGMVHNATDEFSSSLRTAHLRAVQATMAVHAEAVSISNRLAEAGINDVIVLKGCATANLDYEQPFDRFSTDVDLLISSRDERMLPEVFAEASIPPPRRRGWQVRYGKSITVVDSSGVEIDLHIMLAQSYAGAAIPAHELRQYRETFEIGGRAMNALDGPGRLIHAAIHAAGSHHQNLNSARDIPQLVLLSEVDWRQAIERATRWRVESFVAQGVRVAWSEFAIEDHPIVEWARGHRPTGRQELAMLIEGRRPAGGLMNMPLALPIWRWPDYLAPLLFPSQEYLRTTGVTRWQRILRLRGRP